MMGLIIAISTCSSSLILGIKLFLFEIVPSIYLQIFTPLHLFFLLNLLIISILAITHLCKEASPISFAPPRRSSPLSEHETLWANHADHNQVKFAGLMLNDHGNHLMVQPHAEAVQKLEAKNNLMAQRSDRLRRRGDRAVNWAIPAENLHSDVISAASLITYNAVLNDSCSAGCTANDPHLHPNHAVINEAISVDAGPESKKADDFSCYDNRGANVQRNQSVIKEVISEIKMGSAAEIDEQKSKKADYDNNHKPKENEKASSDNADGMHDHLLISSLDPDLESVSERPLASTRFTSKKIANKMHLDMLRSNSPLKVSRPIAKRGDTLDATWKAICDNKSLGHSSPLTRHHKTSYTKKGDHHMNAHNIGDTNNSKGALLSPLSPKQRHHMSTSTSSGFMRKRELSIPRDELNARVESFISRFNQQIRIQREKSLLNYNTMVARGAN